MTITSPNAETLDARIAQRLKALRLEHGLSLEDLALRCHISRSTLSRLEKNQVSPTATVLGALSAVYGLTLSRLLAAVEEGFAAHVRRLEQAVWADSQSGFRRRSVSPPTQSLAAEVVQCDLDAGAAIDYASPPKPGLEHHLIVLQGRLEMTVEGRTYQLGKGDCLRYRLFGASRFAAGPDDPVTYMLVVV